MTTDPTTSGSAADIRDDLSGKSPRVSDGETADSKRGGFFNALHENSWRFFCSLRLTVIVIFLLAAGCVLGMFFDQTLTLEEHRNEWAAAAEWKLRVFEFLEFHDVFHSWWFGFVVLILALNLTACSIERLPKIWIDIQNPIKKLTQEQLAGIRYRYQKTIKVAEKDTALEVLRAILKTKGRHGAEISDSVGFYAFNERHRYARTGVYLVHIALLMIMFGSMATTYTGVDGMMMIVEGSGAQSNVRVRGPGGFTYHHNLDFKLRCTDFRLKTFVDGSPMEFESDLEVHDPAALQNPVLKKTIQVNHPLEYKGYTFYQSSYNPIPGDQLVQLDVCKRPTTEAEVAAYAQCKEDARNIHTVAIGDRVQLPDGTAFVPIEIYRQYSGLGSAVRLQKIEKNGDISSFVVFRNYPKFDERVRRGVYAIGFRGFDQQYATGVQVGRVPWINVVFAGFVLMFVGMYMAFFMSQRRYWARIIENGSKGLELTFAGAARRHQYAFEEEFDKLKATLEEVFGKEMSVAERARAMRASRANAKKPDAKGPDAKEATTEEDSDGDAE